jgi:hypothetical protein
MGGTSDPSKSRRFSALVCQESRIRGWQQEVSLVCMWQISLIRRSGYRLSANSQDVEDMILAVVEDQMNYFSLEEWFKKRLTR